MAVAMSETWSPTSSTSSARAGSPAPMKSGTLNRQILNSPNFR